MWRVMTINLLEKRFCVSYLTIKNLLPVKAVGTVTGRLPAKQNY